MRLDGWQDRLTAVTLAAEKRPFLWGVHDCFTFASDCEEAIMGRRTCQHLLSGYDSVLSAIHVLKKNGWTDCGDAAALSYEQITPLQAQTGDLATVPGEGFAALGVVLGDRVAAPGHGGLAYTPLPAALRAWRLA